MPGISLNGTTFLTASDVPMDVEQIGVLLKMASGTRRWVTRTSGGTPIRKRTWVLPFKNITEASRAAVQVIANLNTTFTFINQRSESFTCQCESDSYSESIVVINVDGSFRYDCSLKLYEV